MNEFGPGWNPEADEARKKALAAEETRRAASIAEQTAGDNSFDDLLSLALGRTANSHELLQNNANQAFGDIADVVKVFESAEECSSLPGFDEATNESLRGILKEYATTMRELAALDESKEAEGSVPGSQRDSMKHETFRVERKIRVIRQRLMGASHL